MHHKLRFYIVGQPSSLKSEICFSEGQLIRIELQGGLGNQLFIWAMAHHLESHFDEHVRIVYPLSKNGRSDRPCEIAGLIQLCEHDVSILESKYLGHATKLIDKLNSIKFLKKIINLNRIGIFTANFSSEVKIEYKKSPRLVRGYFQNTEIVQSLSDQILQELNAYLQSISLPASVNIRGVKLVAHIRRGDTKTISQEFGVLSLDYYKQKIESSSNVVICTDEQSDLEKFYREFPRALIITPTESNPWQTLKILSSTEKLIMANSTLSWWAAWIAKQLGNSEVIFPFPWRPTQSEENHALLMGNVAFANSIFEKSDKEA